MLNNRFLIVVFLIVGVIKAQNFHFQEEMDGAFLERGALTITSTGNTLKIKHPNTGDLTLGLAGIKKFFPSPDGLGFLVTNFEFPSGKNDIQVTYFYATTQNGLLFQSSFTSPFDLPHPKLSIDNSGNIYIFDPMKMVLTVTGNRGTQSVQIQDNPVFEMEKTFYLKCGTDFVLGAVNIQGRADHGKNIAVFRYSPQTRKLQKELIDGSTISFFSFEGALAYISVTLESAEKIEQKSFLFQKDISDFRESPLPNGRKFALGGNDFFITDGLLKSLTADGKVIPIETGSDRVTGNFFVVDDNSVLIEVLNGKAKEFVILEGGTDFAIKNSGIMVSSGSRCDMFLNDNRLFVIEDYNKTLIYSLQ